MLPLDFVPSQPDLLGVLSSTAVVVRGASQVRIDVEAVRRFAAMSFPAAPPAAAQDGLHCTFLPPRRFLNYLLVLEALNFSFWDDEPRWRVLFEGARYDGYWALAAALRRALREDAIPLWDARWMAQVDEAQAATLLRGEGQPIPMLAERAANLREVGEVLLRRWQGEFARVVQTAGGDAVALAQLTADEFPSFRDEALWRPPGGSQPRTVRFLKRAQICVADLARLLPDHPLGQVGGLERLTAFADYKVPQVLRKLGILVYSDTLARRVEAQEVLAAGSQEEIEIRAATIWACEWIGRALGGAAASDVDYRLWLMGQEKTSLPPYHRTRTIYY
jgi:hypothetical protein